MSYDPHEGLDPQIAVLVGYDAEAELDKRRAERIATCRTFWDVHTEPTKFKRVRNAKRCKNHHKCDNCRKVRINEVKDSLQDGLYRYGQILFVTMPEGAAKKFTKDLGRENYARFPLANGSCTILYVSEKVYRNGASILTIQNFRELAEEIAVTPEGKRTSGKLLDPPKNENETEIPEEFVEKVNSPLFSIPKDQLEQERIAYTTAVHEAFGYIRAYKPTTAQGMMNLFTRCQKTAYVDAGVDYTIEYSVIKTVDIRDVSFNGYEPHLISIKSNPDLIEINGTLHDSNMMFDNEETREKMTQADADYWNRQLFE